MKATDVLSFWFNKLSPEDHFKKSEAIDRQMTQEFGPLLKQAEASELWSWRSEPESSLAEVILLDQFSRNIYRDTAQAFKNDPLALSLSQAAISKGYDSQLPLKQRSFLYMPFMHSESKVIHNEAVNLFSIDGMEQTLKFELAHKKIIDKFGRYPHRNKILGRESTKEELEFLKTNSGF